ncbi:MAG: hypothetical protein ABIQ70_01435 [Dokdonella sp.]
MSRTVFGWLTAAALAFFVSSCAYAAQPVGSAFTYQGELRNAGQVANGLYDFHFSLYDSISFGTQIGTTLNATVTVAGGRFTANLDFGADAFQGDRRYLEIAVSPSGGNTYETLTPRQETTGAPYAIAKRVRSIVVSGNGMYHNPSDAQVTATRWGPQLSGTAQPIGFSIPKPADWDSTQTFTVTLYFAVPTLTTSSIVNWRLEAGSQNTNLDVGSANSGWDNLGYGGTEDGSPLNIYAAPGRTNMMKSQTWTAHWSSTYSTWYFGAGVNTNNDFRNDPLWTFTFQRGSGVTGGNGEGYTQGLIVVAAEVQYASH